MRKLILGSLLVAVVPALLGKVSAQGRELYVDGSRFVGRGICYQPTPLGDNVDRDPPHGDYFSSSYSALHHRDLPYLREMGANIVRLYNWEPGIDHREFLDACYNNGDRSLLVLVNRWIDPATDWSNQASVDIIAGEFVAMAEEIVAHPAGFGVVIGNEVNEQNGNGGKASFWRAMNLVAKRVKTAAPSLLVTMAVTDRLGQVARYDSEMDALDAWSVQVYRGSGFGGFFRDYAAASEKPLLITEFGYDNFDNRAGEPYPRNGEYPAEVVVGLLEEAWDARDVCSGLFVFSYLDGLWKAAGNDREYDPGGNANPGFEDGFANEEWWGIFRPMPGEGGVDIVEPRSLYYALRNLWGQTETVEIAISEEGAQWRLLTGNLPLREGQVARIEKSNVSFEEWAVIAMVEGGSLSPTDRSVTFFVPREEGLFRLVVLP